jgi:G3E family GTPase
MKRTKNDEQVFAAPEQMKLKLWQIGCADLVVLNKTDLVSVAQIEQIKSWLDEHFNRYRLIEATRCDVPLEILLSAGRYDASQLSAKSLESNGHKHHNGHACDDPNCQHHHHEHDPITRAPSAPGATKRNSRFRWRRCVK